MFAGSNSAFARDEKNVCSLRHIEPWNLADRKLADRQGSDRLGAGGFSSEQAHIAASALSDVLSVQMATKADVEIAKLQLEARLHEVKSELIKWFIGIAGFQTLVILGSKIFTR